MINGKLHSSSGKFTCQFFFYFQTIRPCDFNSQTVSVGNLKLQTVANLTAWLATNVLSGPANHGNIEFYALNF
jgi:hypothetical protein